MNNDLTIQKLLEHDERFDRIEEKMAQNKNEILTILDQAMTILQRLDQERHFTQAWIKRIETDVEQSKKDIQQIKKTLKIS